MDHKFRNYGVVSSLIFMGLILFSTIPVSSTLTLDQTENEGVEYTGPQVNSTVPIHFWRNRLHVNETHIFPMASLGEGGSFARLGEAWIAWSIQVENKLLPAFAIFSRGQLTEYTLLESFYDDIYWNSVQNSLFLIGVDKTRNETDFYWYSTEGVPLIFTLSFPSSDHEIYFTSLNQEISLTIEEKPFVARLVGRETPAPEEVDEIQISSFPGIGGLYVLENQSIELRTDQIELVIPNNFTQEAKLGHFLLNPTILDVSLGQAVIMGQIPLIVDLPNNTINVYELGFSSSIVQTQNNSFYELTPAGWELIAQFDLSFELLDFSIIDIDLYFGTIIDDGIKLVATGQDVDNDFVPDVMEDYYFSLPETNDSDGDTIPDAIEIAFGTIPTIDDRQSDPDEDGVVNIVEYNNGLDPGNLDSDFGGAIDGWEMEFGFNPHSDYDDLFDNDTDGLVNSIESRWNTNPFDKDTDDDGMPDDWEVRYQLDPLDGTNANLDFDNDGRTNIQEYRLGSDPLIPDPPAIFEGLYLWILILSVIAIPISYYTWKSYIKNEETFVESLEQIVDEEESIE